MADTPTCSPGQWAAPTIKEINMLTLEELRIELVPLWRSKALAGTYAGVVKFKNDGGEIAINIDHETSRAVMTVVADQMVRATTRYSTLLTTEVIEAVSGKLLGGPDA
jgi:hypothetical protein